jgi:CubicO group peptidase (beta-lactamase class C family)
MKTGWTGRLLPALFAVFTPLFASEPPQPAVDEIFAAFDSEAVPGCALGVMRDGAFVYRRGYGMANLEHGIPLSARSVFRIGSTSKQFTAMAVALLAERGALSLDDSLRRYFPEFPAWADDIKIRHLVHHSSGIRDYLELAYLSGLTSDAAWYTDDWVLQLLTRQQETNFPPGEQYLYSNSGYLLLAHLVERVSGNSLSAFAQTHIFGPLGMANTHFHDDHTHIVPGRAAGYAPVEGGFAISMTTLDMVGDGGVYTTIDDLLLWDQNFYRNRLGAGGPALIEVMTTPGRLNNGDAMDYAFGLSVEDYRGLRLVSHGGAFVGYRADLIRFPDQRFSVAVLCNRSDGAPSAKARAVADHYLADYLAPRPSEGPAREVAGPGPAELERYVGDFWEPTEGFAAETRVIDGKLWAVHSPERRNELVPAGPHTFRMVGVGAEVLVRFEMSASGVSGMSRTINGKPRGAFTPFERRAVSAIDLADYAGTYFSPELRVYYALSLHEGKLVFRVADEPARELTALFGETFENPDWGSFVFQRDTKGLVTGFLLQSGRVKNLDFTRQSEPGLIQVGKHLQCRAPGTPDGIGQRCLGASGVSGTCS